MATNDALIRVRLPRDVRDRFAAEASALGKTQAEHLRDLLVARDTRQQEKRENP